MELVRLMVFVTVYHGITGCQRECSRVSVSEGSARFSYPTPVGEVKVSGTNLYPSGLAHSRVFEDVLYFVSANNTGTRVYTIDATNANVIGSISLTDATNVDWGDLAVGICPTGISGSCIFIQDDGSEGNGPAHTIYVIKEGTDPATHVTRQVDMTITYELQPGNIFRKSNGIMVDCSSSIFFYSSTEGGLGLRLYQITNLGGSSVAIGVYQMNLPTTWDGPVALSLSQDCSELLVKMIDKIYYLPVQNDMIQTKRVQLLPYVTDKGEDSIAWGTQQDKYFMLSSTKPFTLKVSSRNEDVPMGKFGLGMRISVIDNSMFDDINGLAASRRHPGFVYAINQIVEYDVPIIQISDAQIVGMIKTGISGVTLNFRDIATGVCPSSIQGPNCIYVNSFDYLGEDDWKVYIFEEPEYLYAETFLSLDSINIIENSLPGAHPTAGHSILVGPNGEVYILDYVNERDTVTVFQLSTHMGTAKRVATFTSPSLHDGPHAVDMSPCFDEIIVKFQEMILLFDVKNNNVSRAFGGTPHLLPYIPEDLGSAVTFADCNAYLTTSYTKHPAPLMIHIRK